MIKEWHKNSKISVIMPAYNEGQRIYDNIKEIDNLFKKLNSRFEIIVVDDASSDNTYTEAERAKAELQNVIVGRNVLNSGKGYAIKKGFSYATGDYVVFLDADLELDPKQIERFFEIMQHDKSDVVIGSKRHHQSKIAYPAYRRILSCGYFFLVKLLFGLPIRDTQTGLKLFKYKVLDKVMPKLLIKTYAFDLEILVLAFSFGYKISEAPVIVDFKGKFSRIGLFDIISMSIDTLAIFYRLKILKYYDYPRAIAASLPKVSILITAKEENLYLKQCIRLCKSLNYPDCEIIVLPDKEIPISDPAIKIIPTGEILPPEKRDIGAKYAQGEILAFIDDDAYPAEDWLDRAVRNFSYPNVSAVGGPATNALEDSLEQKASGAIFSSWIVSGSHVFRFVPKILREVDDYPTCNLLVRKEDFEEAGGFATRFWPGEDTFLCYKLTKILNKKILYDPEAIVHHHRRPIFLPHLKQVGSYALHRGYFVKKFPQTSLRISYFLPSIFIIYLAGNLVFFAQLNNLFRFLFLFLILLYFTFVAFSALKLLNRKLVRLTFIGIVVTHLVYGLFFLKGLLAKKMPEENG